MKFKLLAIALALSPIASFGADIYAKSQVDDLTTTVKQAIIDQRQKK